MKRFVTACALGAVLVVSGASAHAQTFFSEPYRRPLESPQNFMFELRLGEYYPRIDDEFAGRATPYRDIFGPSPHLMFGFEADWQILRLGPVASLGIGASVGFTTITANEPYAARTIDPDPTTWGTRSNDVTGLQVIPVTGVGVLRIDGLARAVPWLPIVPYVKAGIGYSFWYVTTGGAALAQSTNGGSAFGTAVGFHGALGVAVMLDVFEPALARQWDAESGFNHSYLFAEGMLTEMGAARQLNLGALSWTGGIGVEY